MCNLVIGSFPCLNNRFVKFFLSQQTTAVFLGNNLNRILCLLKQIFLRCRHFHIGNRNSHCCLCRIFITKCFNCIERFRCLCCTFIVNTFFQNLFQLLFANVEIYFQFKEVIRIASVNKSKILTDNLIENKSSQCRFNNTRFFFACIIYAKTTNFNFGMKCNLMIFIGNNCLIHIFKETSRSFCSLLRSSLLCQIINTKDHILRRYGYGTTIGWFQQVVR